jgi:hypothetical protein
MELHQFLNKPDNYYDQRPVKSRIYCIHFTAVLTSDVPLFLGVRVYCVKKTQYRQIPVWTFLKYRYYTGPGGLHFQYRIGIGNTSSHNVKARSTLALFI